MPNHPDAPLVIDETEHEALRTLVRAGTSEQRLVMRARVVVAAAEGMADERIADEVGVHKMTVLLWRGRFARLRLAGLADAPRPGRAPTYGRAERDRCRGAATPAQGQGGPEPPGQVDRPDKADPPGQAGRDGPLGQPDDDASSDNLPAARMATRPTGRGSPGCPSRKAHRGQELARRGVRARAAPAACLLHGNPEPRGGRP